MKSSKQKAKKKEEILNQIPIFLAQTYRIVDVHVSQSQNPSYNETIGWTPDGRSFIIKNVPDLTNNIFPQHFKHSNFASFVRQLNMYGFHKVRSSDDNQVFKHDFFQKDTTDLLPFIKRKKGSPADSQKNNQIVAANNSILPALSNKEKQFEGELNILTEKHEGLQKLVTILVQQNKEIIMQNKNFVNKIAKMDETYRRKLQTLIFLMMLGLKNSDGNIIIPQQTHALLKGLRTNKKKEKTSTSSNALQLFRKENNNTSTSNQIHELYRRLMNESEGENSEQEENQNHSLILSRLPSFQQEQGEEDLSSPRISLKSIPSNYYKDDFNDFKIDSSDLLDFGKQD